MPRPPLVSDEELIDRLSTLFRNAGYEGASMARVAEVTGLGKSSLYHRFPGGKQQMAEEVTRHLQRTFADRVLSPATRLDLSVTVRLRRIAANLRSFYGAGMSACLLETLTVETISTRTSEGIARAAGAWTDTFAALSREAGIAPREAIARAQDAIARIEGALVLARATGDTRAFERALRSLPVALTGATTDDTRSKQ